MHPIITQYRILAEFLGKVLGPQYEIVLHDLKLPEDRSICTIVNGQISGRAVGGPMTDLALRFIKEKTYQKFDYKMGYTSVPGQSSPIRSSTLFIKDAEGELIGLLCINYGAGAAMDVMDQLAELLRLDMSMVAKHLGLPPILPEQTADTFSDSVAELVDSALVKVLRDPAIPKERMTQEEKLKVVDVLNQKGVFLLKGAVSEVAAQLCSSEASIYRYLSKLNKANK